ncbi:hypothetical protein AN958_10540 [Leucoagaricus sp. SymC.cos]|nr:hypothetical protein AN958_10540 [Leucoagaricus sp. SymC.cos]
MDLLSPAESHAFQSFLSAMDYADLSPSEWALLNGTNVASDDDLGSGHSSEMLAKATKDLMALDTGRWDSLTQQQQQLGLYSHQSQQQHHQTYPNASSHRQTPYTRRETFPFLNKAQMQQSMLSIPPHHTDLHTHFVSPTATSAPTSANTTPATPQSPFGFPDLPSHPSSHPHLEQVQLDQPHSQQQRPPSPGTKRSSSSAASKRLRPSLPVASTSTNSGTTKQTLLSPSQKKANHIQSEQKRRANIRRGYEALCETVPALREAIREEEEAEARMSMGLGSSGKPTRSKRKKKDAAGADAEKIDGRSGPRSENVILSKTIDYINDLLSEHSSLLARLERARSALPSGQPALVPTCTGEPLWEREWKGGEGRLDGEGGEEEDENNDDGADSV